MLNNQRVIGSTMLGTMLDPPYPLNWTIFLWLVYKTINPYGWYLEVSPWNPPKPSPTWRGELSLTEKQHLLHPRQCRASRSSTPETAMCSSVAAAWSTETAWLEKFLVWMTLGALWQIWEFHAIVSIMWHIIFRCYRCYRHILCYIQLYI